MANPLEKDNRNIACSRRSDSGARAKTKASERAGKKRGEAPLVFFPLFRSLYFSLALFLARAPLSERLEQANRNTEDVKKKKDGKPTWSVAAIVHSFRKDSILPVALFISRNKVKVPHLITG